MAILDFEDVVEQDMNIPLFEVSEGDIGNWRAVLDGTFLQNTALEDGVPEGNNVDVILDDRDGPVATYDSFSESRYVLGIDIPTHLRAIEEVLSEGSGQVIGQTAANLQNTVGNPAAEITTDNGAEIYLVKMTGSPLRDFVIERCGFAHIDPDNFRISRYDDDTLSFVNLSSVTATDVQITNRHKGTIEVTNVINPDLITFSRGTRYQAELSGGDVLRVRYIDEDLEDGDLATIIGLQYKHSQLDNTGDYQVDRRVANARRQQLTLYRPLGNSSRSRIWVRRIYPDVRLVGPAAESTATGQNSVNTRRWNFRVERMRQPSAQSDYYYEQKVVAPVA